MQLFADKYLLGTMCWKWTGDELQANITIYSGKSNFLNI